MENTPPAQKQSILECLKELKDYRRKQGQRHSLQIVFIIIIMAIMSGAKSERAIVRFAKNNREKLIELLNIKRQEVPSRSVIRGSVQNTDFESFERVFYKWCTQFISIEKGEWMSIDGKSIGGTVVNAHDKMQSFISLAAVFAGKRKQALSVGKISANKENEMQTVGDLINMLDLQYGFTLDALHCQTKTVDTIVSGGNDYVINVKNNQKNLLNTIKKQY